MEGWVMNSTGEGRRGERDGRTKKVSLSSKTNSKRQDEREGKKRKTHLVAHEEPSSQPASDGKLVEVSPSSSDPIELPIPRDERSLFPSDGSRRARRFLQIETTRRTWSRRDQREGQSARARRVFGPLGRRSESTKGTTEAEPLTSIENILLRLDSTREERSSSSHVRRHAERGQFLIESDLPWRF